MADKVSTIKVKSNRTDGKVALWEAHPDHPGGEVYIAIGAPTVDVPESKAKVVEVAETPKVLGALKEGLIVKVSDSPATKAAPAPKTDK